MSHKRSHGSPLELEVAKKFKEDSSASSSPKRSYEVKLAIKTMKCMVVDGINWTKRESGDDGYLPGNWFQLALVVTNKNNIRK